MGRKQTWQPPYHRNGTVVPFDRKRRRRERDVGERAGHERSGGWSAALRGVWPGMIALPLAVFTAVFLWDVPTGESAEVQGFLGPAASAAASEGIAGVRFTECGEGPRVNCVVDGDTIWLAGTRIRIADIDTPEVFSPDCDAELARGEAATRRLTALLNEGPFTLTGTGQDRYGRALRVVKRRGASVGERLVDEGLAVEWGNGRPDWC